MTIQIGKIKLVWFENVFGWTMTGITGPDARWFLGYSQKPYPVHDNSDLCELLQQATPTQANVGGVAYTPPDTYVDTCSDSNLKARTAQVASLLRSSESYVSKASTATIELINVFERYGYGQASLEALKLALYNFRVGGCYPIVLQYFLQQPDEVTRRVKGYILSLPQIEASLQKLSYINNSDLVRLEIDYCFDIPCPICGASSDQQCSIPDPDYEGFAIELGGWVHRQRIEN